MAVAGADGMRGGSGAVAHRLMALHALRPGGRRRWTSQQHHSAFDAADRAHRRRAAGRCDGAPRATAIALGHRAGSPARRAADRARRGRGTCARNTAKTGRDAGSAALSGRGEAVGGRRATGERGTAARGRGGRAHRRPCSPHGHAGGRAARHDRTARGQAGPDRGARTELRAAGDQAIGDAGTEDAEAEQRERGKHDRHRVVDRSAGCRRSRP